MVFHTAAGALAAEQVANLHLRGLWRCSAIAGIYRIKRLALSDL